MELKRKIMFWMRRLLSKDKKSFALIYGLNSHYRERLLVNNKTKLVVESFPRSANTHLVVTLEKLFGPSLHIAHHMHSEAQVLSGVSNNIPTLVIVRDPVPAITSLCVRESFISPKQAIQYYIDFHRVVSNLSDKLLVVSFKSALQKNDDIFKRVEKATGCSYEEGCLLSEDEYTALITELNKKDKGNDETISLPTKGKEVLKEKIFEEIKSNKHCADKLREAQEIYDHLKEKAI